MQDNIRQMVGFVQYLGRADYATSAAGTGIAYNASHLATD